MLAGANRMVYWLSGCAPDKHFGASHLPYRERSISGILAGRCCEGCPVNMQANPTPNPAIEIRGVSYVLPNGETLLSGLNLRVERGETLVLLGRSGSGKTTTLKLINRLLTPASGDVLVNGKSTAESDVIRLRRSIGYVIQDVGLFPHYTVERNIGIAPKLEGWDASRIHRRIEELLQLVGLETSLAQRYPHQLSGGQRQRVGVARALAADPAILLMDEPFGALDALTRAQLQHEFRSLQQRLNKTVVFVTHDLSEALRLGSRIALMDAGRLVAVLPPKEFVRSNDPLATAYVQAFAEGLEFVANRGD
jgi:osmoprotectant transport system ATP-binding protein